LSDGGDAPEEHDGCEPCRGRYSFEDDVAWDLEDVVSEIERRGISMDRRMVSASNTIL
jgi:hypothetical protein